MNELGRAARIRRLFDEVVDLGPTDRTARLAEACGADEALRREVESLLAAADDRASGLRRALEGFRPAIDPSTRASGAASTDLVALLNSALSGRYVVERVLGEGGMATVYLTRDLKHGRDVALKVLRPELMARLGRERFRREIAIAARLSHPHILPLHDSGEVDGIPYFVMPVATKSLRDELANGPLRPERVRSCVNAIAAALDYAHAKGVIHRDLKPSNIMVHEGVVAVADLGIALTLEEDVDPRLTGTGQSLGTPAYMSPEQIMGERALDARTDVFALGCIAYEMLTGKPAYAGASHQAVIARILTGEPPRVAAASAGSDEPGPVDAAIRRALARDPADRFPTASALAAALDSALTSGGAISTASGASRGRSWRKAGGAIGALAVILALWQLFGSRGVPTRSGDAADSTPVRTLAILPATVRGSPALAATLHEGIVDLLHANLGNLDNIRIVDPGTTIRAAGKETETGAMDVATAVRLGSRHGWDLVILPVVTENGGEVRMRAPMYDVASPDSALVVATAQGDTGSTFGLVDQLSAQLIRWQFGAASSPVVGAALQSSESGAAWQAFLDGEKALRRSVFDTAIAAFQRAVAADSNFAPAHLRLAIAAALTETDGDYAHLRGAVLDALPRALGLADRLGQRDRAFLESIAAFRAGDGDAAEAGFRNLLRDYGADLEARFFLAQVLLRLNVNRGRSPVEAKPVFEQVLQDDPGFTCTICPLYMIAGVERDPEALDSLSARIQLGRGGGDLTTRLMVALARGDTAKAEAALDSLGNRTSAPANSPLTIAAWGDHDFAERAARAQTNERQPADRQLAGHLNLATILAARGRWTEAKHEIARAQRMDPRFALIVGATLATLPFLHVPGDDLARLRDQARSWTVPPVEPNADPTRAYDRHARLHLLALLSSKLGEYEAATAYADSLGLIPDPAGSTVAGDLAASVRADISWRSGEPAMRVLQSLEAVRGHVPVILWQDPVFALDHARYLRAYALLTAGRADEALDWLRNTFGITAASIYYPAGVNYLAARALDALSRPGEAHEARAEFEKLWARAEAPIDLPGAAANPPRR